MHVVYISNEGITKDEALIRLKFYCESSDELHFYSSIKEAKDFLSQKVISIQKHMDFVITDWKFQAENCKSLLDWIRESTNTYSTENFQFRSLPVILIEDTIERSSFINEGFDAIVSDFPSNNLKLKLGIKSAIKEWRYNLADDLQLIGLDPRTQKEYENDRAHFISYYRLKVLSKKFVNNRSKKLQYIWTFSNYRELNDSNQNFFDIMRWTMHNRPKDMEKRIHQFILQNPTFVKGEDFVGKRNDKASMLYEKHLFKNGTRSYIEPDFMNKPREFALRNPEIFEIKRQSQRLLRYSKDKFLSSAKKSFEQVKRYKEYLTSNNQQNEYYIVKHLGQISKNYELTLLMGSLSEKLEYLDLIGELKKEINAEDINVLSYEELLERHIRICDRLEEFDIF